MIMRQMQSKWTLRLITSLLWAIAIASTVYWGLRVTAQRSTLALPITPSQSTGESPLQQIAIARLLGAPEAVSDMPAQARASRFTLAGVVSEGANGAALLAIDGKPAKPYRVGSHIDDATLLQSVGPRFAILSASLNGPVLQRLEIAPPVPIKGVFDFPPAALSGTFNQPQ